MSILLAAAALVAFVAISWLVWDNLRQNVWVYYTDEGNTSVGVDEDKARFVLWEEPVQNVFTEEADPLNPDGVDAVNQEGDRLEATFSPNGTTMILVRRDNNETGSDMYLSQWDGRVWSRPEAIVALNSDSNDRGPAFSRDGEYLYFASDREGGKGGYDLYVAPKNAEGWGAAESLGEAVNTANDELGPAPAADGRRLFFSSDRGGKSDDILVAEIIPEATDRNSSTPEQEPPSLMPRFSIAEPVSHLNSEADDVQAALTKRGDHIFLASDRERNDQSGFGLYISRVAGGKESPPEKLDLYFNKGDATDPAVRMEGFDLLFSSNFETEADPGQETGDSYLLYRSTTREVFEYTDLSRWDQFMELLGNIIWWVLLALAALAALIYLLEHWKDITNLYHKCLAGSVALHLIVLFLMMIWLITKEFSAGGEPQSPEIAISIDALAQEELALESTPEEAQISETPIALITDRLESDFKIPVLEAQEYTKTTPIVTRTSKTSLVSDVRPSKANTESAEEPVTKPDEISPLL
ncbi:MAG: hypothetical protein HN727_08565, partial [Opitutae bacterium]|nr:hypothetical protein [Opitutae bacterium]